MFAMRRAPHTHTKSSAFRFSEISSHLHLSHCQMLAYLQHYHGHHHQHQHRYHRHRHHFDLVYMFRAIISLQHTYAFAQRCVCCLVFPIKNAFCWDLCVSVCVWFSTAIAFRCSSIFYFPLSPPLASLTFSHFAGLKTYTLSLWLRLKLHYFFCSQHLYMPRFIYPNKENWLNRLEKKNSEKKLSFSRSCLWKEGATKTSINHWLCTYFILVWNCTCQCTPQSTMYHYNFAMKIVVAVESMSCVSLFCLDLLIQRVKSVCVIFQLKCLFHGQNCVLLKGS